MRRERGWIEEGGRECVCRGSEDELKGVGRSGRSKNDWEEIGELEEEVGGFNRVIGWQLKVCW